jgi:hypothetical protein
MISLQFWSGFLGSVPRFRPSSEWLSDISLPFFHAHLACAKEDDAMPRDLQILLLFLAVLVGIGAYVLLDDSDLETRSGQPAIKLAQQAPDAAPAAPAFEPTTTVAGGRCVEMRFFDEKDVVIPVDPPLVGIMIGEGPLFEGSPPPFARTEAGRFMQCPQALLASVRKSFDDLCSSDERRKKTAADNGVDMATVNKRCGDLSAALAK